MKTIITICLLVSVSLISELSLASGNFKVNIAPKSESKALMEISNNVEQKYEISLSNSSGEVLYRHKTKGEHSKLNKVFDFSKSDYDTYRLIVKLDGESTEQLLTVSETGILVGEPIKKTDPFFSFNDNMLILSFINHNQEDMSINIYSGEELIWGQKLKNTPKINKGFDLSKLDTGNYSVVFATDTEFYEYEFRR